MMISDQSQNIAERAKAIYSRSLQAQLESEHPNQYVAIEPDAEEHFVANSFSGAVAAARRAHPDRISFVIRIGHEAALHLGGVAK